MNALFLNAFGTKGSAVVVRSHEANSHQLNGRNLWEYDAVWKTADDRDVAVQFDTVSASIYPIRNGILIPPENEPFAEFSSPLQDRLAACRALLRSEGGFHPLPKPHVQAAKTIESYFFW